MDRRSRNGRMSSTLRRIREPLAYPAFPFHRALYGALSLWRLIARDTVVGAGDRRRARASLGQRLRMHDVRHIVSETDRRRAELRNDHVATIHRAIWEIAGGVGRRANTIEHPGDTTCRRHGARTIAAGWADQFVG